MLASLTMKPGLSSPTNAFFGMATASWLFQAIVVFITSIIRSSVRPDLSPMASASVVATMIVVARTLLVIFIAWPMPGPPQR